ncbi:IS66 family insertion sequence element accessory protein TnpA [Thiolapillus sp.]|uniref:IS66 family insertion sequence element accessory protein TnpA n=2 Tax=Thiolapillus sp. TaxID=2017437 RepID=UPI0025DC8FA9|nr:IS66 family insertion sequence element accessory protein TnpB [Thiolapillus sp.]
MSRRRNKTEWQRLIDEQTTSGLSQKAFCQQVGIPLATFGYWKRKLQAESGSTPTGSSDTFSLADWVELPPQGSASGGGWQIELDLGNGLCLRLRRD